MRCAYLSAVLIGVLHGSHFDAAAAIINVPQVESTITEALGVAASGDLIAVAGNYTDEPTTPLRMKPGVSIVPQAGTGVPHIDSSADTAVVFDAGSYSTASSISGFRITGFSDAGVVVYGNTGSATLVIENCEIEGDGVTSLSKGIFAESGSSHPVRISGNEITGVQYGVYLEEAPASWEISSNLVESAEYGLLLVASSGTVAQNTFLDNAVAIDDVSGSDATIEYNLIVGSSSYGVGCLGTLSDPATIRYNVFYDNTANFVSGGTCHDSRTDNVTDDPEFCASAISVHVNSPCAPANNVWNTRVGAGRIGCASGTLANSTTLSTTTAEAAGVIVTADLTVPSTKTLTVQSGVTVLADGTDEGSTGSSGAENEITVSGKLVVTGTNSSKAVFTSTAGSPAAGDWFGINVTSGGDLRMEFARVQYTTYGVSTATTDTVKIEKSVFEDNLANDILIGNAPTLLLISRNVLTTENIGIELRNTDFSTTTVSNNKVTGCSTAVAGIKIEGVDPTGSATVSTDTVTAFSTGAAIWVKNSSSIFTNNRLTDNKYGFHVQGGTAAIGTSSSSSDNVMIDNTRAIFAEGVGPGTCRTEVVPVVRNNLMQSNTYGLVTEKTASPDLGTGSGDKGLNSFISNDTYCIWNRANSSCGSISAYGNYYGECEEGQPPICYSGLVDLGVSECTQPSSFRRGFIDVTPAIDPASRPLSITSLSPNPARGPVVVAFRVGGAGECEVRAEVFDVSGRLVRSLGGAVLPQGNHELVWDGSGDAQQSVSEGMYFVRLRLSDGTVETAKVLVVR